MKPAGSESFGYEEQCSWISPMPSPSMSMVCDSGADAQGDVVARRRERADGDRRDRHRHAGGRDGFGIGMLNVTGPVESDAGVAPVASMVVFNVPVRDVRPVAAASCAIDGGKLFLGLKAGQIECLTHRRARWRESAGHDDVVEDDASQWGAGTEGLVRARCRRRRVQ